MGKLHVWLVKKKIPCLVWMLIQLLPRHALLGRHGAVDPDGRLLWCGQAPIQGIQGIPRIPGTCDDFKLGHLTWG
jgi:hypothetical protein